MARLGQFRSAGLRYAALGLGSQWLIRRCTAGLGQFGCGTVANGQEACLGTLRYGTVGWAVVGTDMSRWPMARRPVSVRLAGVWFVRVRYSRVANG